MRYAICSLFFGMGLAVVLGVGVVDPSDWGVRVAYGLLLPLLGLMFAVYWPSRKDAP